MYGPLFPFSFLKQPLPLFIFTIFILRPLRYSMNQDYSNNKTLIKGIRNRTNEAFEYIQQKCFPAVRGLIKSSKGSDDDVKDIYNEGIADLIEIFDKSDLKKNRKVISLFIIICRNKWLDSLKRQGYADLYLDTINEYSYELEIEKKLDDAMYSDILWQSFDKLKNDCQKIIGKFLNGKSLKEIAKSLRLKYAYVKKKKHYCHKSLLKFVHEHEDYTKMKDDE
jgi:RNA polymerase sigma factor (sigma-70 family)